MTEVEKKAEELKTTLDNLVKNSATKEEVNKLVEDLKNLSTKADSESLKKEIENLTEIVKTIQEASQGRMEEGAKNTLKSIVFDNYEVIKEACKNKKEIQFEFKAVAPHVNSNGTISAGTVTQSVTTNVINDENVVIIRTPENFILGVIPNRTVAKVRESRKMKEQASKEGDAGLTAEGAVKPLIQYKFVMTDTSRDKYAGRIEWSEEFEIDQEALLSAIIRMLERDVITAWQDGIIDEIMTNATAYVSSDLDGTLVNPDNGLAGIAIASQIQSLEGRPDVVFMNTGDIIATVYQQDTDGNFMQKPYIDVVNMTIGGMRLISSWRIPKGEIVVGESGTYTEEHTNYIMRTGQYDKQFITNEYTIIGEVFSLLSIAQLHLKYWVKADLDAVKTALKKA